METEEEVSLELLEVLEVLEVLAAWTAATVAKAATMFLNCISDVTIGGLGKEKKVNKEGD